MTEILLKVALNTITLTHPLEQTVWTLIYEDITPWLPAGSFLFLKQQQDNQLYYSR